MMPWSRHSASGGQVRCLDRESADTIYKNQSVEIDVSVFSKKILNPNADFIRNRTA
jgi:hypothetical protein